MNDKIKPAAERLARLEGCTSYRDLREGFGGIANITDQDIAAALAIARRHEWPGSDIGPELLETYFGSTQAHRRKLVYAYMATFPAERGEVMRLSPRRMAATLAAQEMCGFVHSRGQQAEYAYIVGCRLERLRDELESAYRWFLGELDRCLGDFREIVSGIVAARILLDRQANAKRTRAQYEKAKAA